MSFVKGWIGEQGVRAVQWLDLDAREYHCFYDLLVPVNARYTQIDHVIVSRYGVFVVETKNRRGWIFGREHEDIWTAVLNPQTRIPFQNPLHQNKLHTRSIAEFCAIDREKIHPVVVFWGDCELKTEMPENVVKDSEYIGYVKSKHQVLLGEGEVCGVCNRLDTVKGRIPILSSFLHGQAIKTQRNSPDICPWCKGTLVVRTARRGRATGQRFIGCSNYPRCRFNKPLD